MRRWFLDHPQSVGETYSQHFGMAFGFSAALIAAGAACFVHALIPALFQKTASRTVTRLFHMMNARQAEGIQTNGVPQKRRRFRPRPVTK